MTGQCTDEIRGDVSTRRRALDFFGRITAGATHELKNELAVINEQSRLIQELLEAARNGREVSTARIEELIGRVVVRISRADDVVRRLNAFAHTADEGRTGLEAGRTLSLLLRLAERTASMKGVTLASEEPQFQATVHCDPILWERTVYACIESALAVAAKGSTLKVRLERDRDSLDLIFEGDLSAEGGPGGEAPKALDPGVNLDRSAGQWVLRMPVDCDNPLGSSKEKSHAGQ
jgi:signal transduction histidine kinase